MQDFRFLRKHGQHSFEWNPVNFGFTNFPYEGSEVVKGV